MIKLHVVNVTFENNRAEKYGKDIYGENSNNVRTFVSEVEIRDSKFLIKDASHFLNEAIKLDNCKVKISNCLFEH